MSGMVDAMAIKTAGLSQQVKYLSGGNKQKVVFGKWLSARCNLLILDEPTIGIDVGARGEIYELIRQFVAEENRAVIFISSDMDEILEVADRILVMSGGSLVAELDPKRTTKQEIMQYSLQACASKDSGARAGVMKQARKQAKRPEHRKDPWPVPQPGGLDAGHPGHHVGGARVPVALLLHGRQPLRDHPADRRHRHHRRGRDVRHHLRRHRPVGRLRVRLLGRGRRPGVHEHAATSPWRWPRRSRRRPVRPDQRPADHAGARAALHRARSA